MTDKASKASGNKITFKISVPRSIVNKWNTPKLIKYANLNDGSGVIMDAVNSGDDVLFTFSTEANVE